MHELRVFFIYMVLWSIRADDYPTKCPGPLAFYKELDCKPVNNTFDDGCFYQYDCSNVKSLSFKKCYVNHHAYDVGEPLKEEDANPCNIGCVCAATTNGVSKFKCAVVDCFHGPVKPGCYRKNSPLQCCPGEEVCPENPEDRATCNVDGKVYKDGEHFEVDSDPDLSCVCQPGYKGENIEPFCAKPKHPYCDPLFTDPDSIKKNCAPVYYSSQSLQTDCSVFSKCQTKQDMVVKSDEAQPASDVCYFGSLVMHYGDELKQNTDYNSQCVKCICEVGPTPTCQRLPDNECDVTNTNFLDRLRDYGSSMVEKLRESVEIIENIIENQQSKKSAIFDFSCDRFSMEDL